MAGGSKRRSWPRFLARNIIPCLLVSLVVGVCAHDTWNRRQLEVRLAEAREQGPVTFEEIQAARRPWADEENAALVLWELRDRLRGLDGLSGTARLIDEEVTWVELPRWFRPKEEYLEVTLTTPEGVVVDYVAEPELNPCRFRIEADQAGIEVDWHVKPGYLDLPVLGEKGFALGERWDAETLQDVRSFLSSRQDLLEQIDRMAEFEGGRLPFVIAPNPIDTGSQGLDIVRSAFKLKALQMQARVMSGRTDALIDDMQVLQAIGRILEDDPGLQGSLVRIALHAATVDYIQDICAISELNDETLEALTRILESMEKYDRLYWGMLGERALWYEVYNVSIDTLVKKPFFRGMAARNMSLAFDHYAHYLERARNSIKALVPADATKQSSPVPDSPYYFLASIMMPSLERSFELDVNLIARARAARAALAVERYRLKTGSVPESLAALVPEYIERLPEDPFNREPLRFQVEEDGRMLIYSVGRDGQDDGGLFDPKKHETDGLDQGFILLPVEQRGAVAGE